MKISGKERKRCSIWIKVDLCEVFLSYNIYCLLFYFMTVVTPFLLQICVFSLTRGRHVPLYSVTKTDIFRGL